MVAMRYRVAPATAGIFAATTGAGADPQQSVVQVVAPMPFEGFALRLVISSMPGFETLYQV